MRPLPSLALLGAAALAASLLPAASTAATVQARTAAPSSAAEAASVRHDCLRSVPDPGGDEAVDICFTVFRPAGASGRSPVPLVLHSHGWGGSRTTDPAAFERWLAAGYGVLSFDQRGFGESGGHAHVESPRVEGHDVQRLIGRVSRLPWVLQDGPRDPRLGAIGGSYGGGYQYLAAFTSLQRRGSAVLDALAPEITWFDLNQSLAPQGVPRSAWALALSAAAARSDALPPEVYKALTEGVATGTWPDGSVPGTEDMQAFFRRNGPRWHLAQGRRLDIPALIGQGTTDTLFPLEQGLRTYQRAFTREAREQSLVVGYNGGHVLPAVFPRGVSVDSDPCSAELGGGSFDDLAVRFMDRHLRGERVRLPGRGQYHLATPAGTCTSVGSVRPDTAYDVGTVATTEAGGAPLAYEVARGPVRIAGTAVMTGTLTALGAQNRAFYGLAVGSTPTDAELVQNNVLPLAEPAPVVGERRRVELPAVAVDVPEGQNLYVVASPVSDTFVGMGSRTPGAVVLEDAVVRLPVVDPR